MLSLHYLEGMSAQQIGAMYRVHARTVQRWISDSRQQILVGVRKLLKKRLGLQSSQLQSLTALVVSQLEVSMIRLLPKPPPPG